MLVGCLAVALATGLTTGCSGKLTAGLGVQELVVYFNTTATQGQRVAVLHNCTGYPNASPEPLPPANANAADELYEVRFRVDKASDYQLNQVTECVDRQPGVVGTDIEDSEDS